jgi:hypothetical protein
MAFRKSSDVTVDAKMVTEIKLTSHCFTLMLSFRILKAKNLI